MVFTWNLHFHKYFDFTTFPFILPPGKGKQGRFLLLCFPAKLRIVLFQCGVFLFSFSSLHFPSQNAKRQQKRDEGEPLKIPKSSPTSKNATYKPSSILKHSKLMERQVFAKLLELNSLLKNPFLLYARHPSVAALLQMAPPLSPRLSSLPPLLAGSICRQPSSRVPQDLLAWHTGHQASWP